MYIYINIYNIHTYTRTHLYIWIMKLVTSAPLGLKQDKLNPFHTDFHSPPLFFVSACGLK